ncbi:MAG: hypothetical protein HY331_05045 [Chloroflexi bacterium]|nr:hypothetical protein [Chloroflexota bacterium]
MLYPELSASSLAPHEVARLDEMLGAVWRDGRQYVTAPALAERFSFHRYEAAEMLLAAASVHVVRRLNEQRCPDCDTVALLVLEAEELATEAVICPSCGRPFKTGPATRWTGFWLRPPREG